jgi:hypothetical protein
MSSTKFDYFAVAKKVFEKAKDLHPQRFSLQEKGAEQQVVEHIMQQCKQHGVSDQEVLKKLPQEMQAYQLAQQQAKEQKQLPVGQIAPGNIETNPVNFRGEPVSPEQAKPEPGLEDVMMPHEYLQGAGGLVGGVEKVLASKTAQEAPAALALAKQAFNGPKAMAGLYRDWAERIGGEEAKQVGERLASAIEKETPLMERLTNAAKAYKNYGPRPDEEVALIKDVAASAKSANKIPESVGKFIKGNANDATAVVGKPK